MASQILDEEYAREWLVFAEMDVNSAGYLINMRPRPDEIICYLSRANVDNGTVFLYFWRQRKTEIAQGELPVLRVSQHRRT
jgi:hypothetical protein